MSTADKVGNKVLHQKTAFRVSPEGVILVMASTLDVNTYSAIHQRTPNVTVVSNVGLVVRQLAYYSGEAEKAAEVRINLQRYNDIGQLTGLIDSRLSKNYLKKLTSTTPNQSQVNTLSGVVLQSKNVDAGLRVNFSNVRGLMLWTNDSLGNERTFEYDKLARVTSVYEKVPGKKALCCERFVYGNKANKETNGVGRLLRHYDSAGLREIKSYSILGSVLNESRQFLETTETISWPENLAESQKLLEKENYATQWQYNGLGETIRQTDAKGNQHNTVYGVTGELVSTGLQLANGTEQALITKQSYSAAAQLLEKHLSNGVVIKYGYEEETQRLSRLHSVRLSDSKSLQDLNYGYDPVGNILEIIDKAKEPDFYANEKTEAISQYRYDSLYQLIEASGIESQQAAKESATQNPALRLGNFDASRCVNYTRTYTYDAGGNLYEIRHRGAQSYTQALQIAADSNRGIAKRDSGPTLIESFDGNGNLFYFNTDQPLQWDSRNQLQQVIQLKRETDSDEEQYRYDASGQRVEKLTQRLRQGQIHSDRVRYLPGLELREHWQTDIRGQNKKVTEQLQLIQSDGIRVLHWETGKPNDIENDGLRYTLMDQLGSTQLELNAKGEIISYENYYPYGGTAIWATKNTIEASYQFVRYSGKERDVTGLYYYGYRYYIPWLGRWLNPDPSGISDGLNLFRMARNNPIIFYDDDGRMPKKSNPNVSTFKELYPEEKWDIETGKKYRTIRTVYSYNREVDVTVWEAGEEIGKRNTLYWFTGPKKAKRLFMEPHGSFSKLAPQAIIHFKSDMPTVTTLNPHGKTLVSNITDVNQIYAKISHEGIELSSEQAKQHFEKSGYPKITGTTTKIAMLNYDIEKFPTNPHLGTEFSYMRHLFEDTAYYVWSSHMKEEESFDYVAVRKYRGTKVNFLDILLFAKAKGYQEVVFGSCRVLREQPESKRKEFIAYETVALENPEFISWEKIGKAPSKVSKIFSWLRR
jgi:insecticidal toxin complex protein TccC